MVEVAAREVKALRDATGAGMMDAKRALVAANGDHEAAAQALREKGLAKAVGRPDRHNTEGTAPPYPGLSKERHSYEVLSLPLPTSPLNTMQTNETCTHHRTVSPSRGHIEIAITVHPSNNHGKHSLLPSKPIILQPHLPCDY